MLKFLSQMPCDQVNFKRQKLFLFIQKSIQKSVLCSVNLFGSSRHNFHFATSDLDISVQPKEPMESNRKLD